MTNTWTWDAANATGKLSSRTNGAFTQTYTYRAGDGKPTNVATNVQLGSVDRVSDGNGAPASTLSASSFDPFGGRRAADWSGDEPPATAANVLALQDERFSRGFTDHEGLHRTGFVHMNGRVYDPRIGRFLQPDPVVSAPGTGQGHNRYAYVANAPLSATDPSGFMPVGGYVGRTGGVADYGALYGSLMTELWSAGGFLQPLDLRRGHREGLRHGAAEGVHGEPLGL